MMLANYINDLLYQYDCVIIPNFGGFITNKVGAKVNNNTHTFYPPTKQLSFNAHLKHNDGLLANFIASNENISFDSALETIQQQVGIWNDELKNSSITIGSVGTLSLNEYQQLIFEPNSTSNFLTDSFGFTTVQSSLIERFKEEVKPLQPISVITSKEEEESKKGIPAFIKYAASIAILLTLGVAGYNSLNRNNQQQLVKQQKMVEEQIQQATFVIDTPLPTVNLTVTKDERASFYVIAGAFELKNNAAKKVRQLKRKGFNASVIGKNRWGLIQVSVGDYKDELKARKLLKRVRKVDSSDAWLFIK